MDADRGRGNVKEVAKIIVAILLIVIAWKLLKFAIGIAIGIAVVGLVIYGGVKLFDATKRIK
jgi:hypothetical protein